VWPTVAGHTQRRLPASGQSDASDPRGLTPKKQADGGKIQADEQVADGPARARGGSQQSDTNGREQGNARGSLPVTSSLLASGVIALQPKPSHAPDDRAQAT
jgi:hypothetical protein